MTEAEFFEQILGIKEIHVDRVDWQEKSLHIYCSSVFEEALCPHCLKTETSRSSDLRATIS